MPPTYTAPITIRKMDHFQAVLHAKKSLLDVRFLNIHMICLQPGSHIGMITSVTNRETSSAESTEKSDHS